MPTTTYPQRKGGGSVDTHFPAGFGRRADKKTRMKAGLHPRKLRDFS
jgi:hypothetical protein